MRVELEEEVAIAEFVVIADMIKLRGNVGEKQLQLLISCSKRESIEPSRR